MCVDGNDVLQMITNLLQAIGVPFAIIYAAYQAREAAKARNIQALIFVLDQLGSVDMRDARAKILKFPQSNYWNEEQRDTARRVCVALDRVAFLYKIGALDDRVFYWFIPGVFEELWDALKGFVEDIQHPPGGRKGRPGYCKTLKSFVENELPGIMRRQGRNELWERLRADPVLPLNWDE